LAIALVQTATSESVGLAFGSAPTNGNCLFLMITIANPGDTTVTAVTESNVNWRRVGGSRNGAVGVELWYAPNVQSAGTSVTITTSTATGYHLLAAEYSGLATTDTLDFFSANQGTSSTVDSGSFTTRTPNQLWIGCLFNGVGTVTFNHAPTNGFTETIFLGDAGPSFPSAFETKIVSSVGTANVSDGMTASQPWVGFIAAFSATPVPSNTIHRVQSASNGFSGASSVVVTLPATPTSGNTLLLAINMPASATVTSVASTGATWVKDTAFTSGFAWRMETWRASTPGTGTTITVTTNVASQGVVIVEEWTGLTASPLDQFVTNSTGPLASPNTVSTLTTATTTSPVELWWAAMEIYPSNNGGTGLQASPTNGFTISTEALDTGVSGKATLATSVKIVSTVGTAQTTSTSQTGGQPFYTMTSMNTYAGFSSAGANQLMLMGVGV
jgi:hypothetical protein